MTCLDDETVLGLVEGRLGDGMLATIDEHLDGCASCREVVTHVAHTRTAVQPLERGFTLGRYVVGDLVGEGAMGRVYAAWEPELDRRVAVKVLQDDAPGARERLVREAQAMARLDHPNVVGVHEVGTSARGVYVAMELVDGETLRAWAAHAPPWREVGRVLADVARGLAAVHAAGVLHRDVKPDNVIVGADGRARIGDFGLARSEPAAARPSTGDALALGTPKTAAAGTPAYMAPEVLHGAPATEASDQFSFGVTAYEILGGHRPFDGRSWKELARAIETTAVAKLPNRLDAVIRRCLAADPAKRHASMTEVAGALDAATRGPRPAAWIALGAALVASGVTFAVTRPDAAPPTCDVAAIARTWTPQARAALDAPSVAAVDRWVTAWQTSRETVCAAKAPAPVIAARDRCLERRHGELAALLARGSSERFVDALASLPPSECTTLALGAADPLPLDPQQRAEADAVAAGLPAVRAAIALGDAWPVQDGLTRLAEHARASNHAPTLAEVLLLQAEAARTLSNLPEAARFARDATAAAERGRDDLAAARAWIERVTIAGDRRELVAAEDLAALADAATDRAGAPPHLVARLLRIRGLVAFNRGQPDEARRLLLAARAGFVTVAGERSVEVAGVETSLGAVERIAGDLDAAERHHRLAHDIDRELRGETHPDIARDLHNLAGIERLRGKLDAALALYRQALAIEDARGPESVQSALTRNSIGLVLMEREDWVGARAELTRARDAFAKAGHGDLAFTEHNLGLVAAASKDPRTALAHFDAAERGYQRTIGGDAVAPIRLHLDRARARAALGERRAARTDTATARELAARARIEWIVDDANALDARTVRAPPPPPAPVPEPPGPTPKRDVGVYGSSQGW